MGCCGSDVYFHLYSNSKDRLVLRFPKLDLWGSLLLFVGLNVFDAAATTYILSDDGLEGNPLFYVFLRQGFTVYQAKIALLVPLSIVWMKLYRESAEKAEVVVDIGNWILSAVVVYEIIGLSFMLLY